MLPPLLLGLLSATAATYAPPYAVLNFSTYGPLFRSTAARPGIKNYSAWAQNNVPLLDFPADADIQTAYYYRWRLFREHTESTHVAGLALIDEFLPKPGGRGPISCAAGHHFAEGMVELHGGIDLQKHAHLATVPIPGIKTAGAIIPLACGMHLPDAKMRETFKVASNLPAYDVIGTWTDSYLGSERVAWPIVCEDDMRLNLSRLQEGLLGSC